MYIDEDVCVVTTPIQDHGTTAAYKQTALRHTTYRMLTALPWLRAISGLKTEAVLTTKLSIGQPRPGRLAQCHDQIWTTYVLVDCGAE